MKLVNMQLSTAEMAEKDPCCGPSPERPRYPWGLSISLDNDTLEKLGLELPKVGSELLLAAKVTVTSVSANEGSEGVYRNVSLQITDLAFEGDEAIDAADILYGKK